MHHVTHIVDIKKTYYFFYRRYRITVQYTLYYSNCTPRVFFFGKRRPTVSIVRSPFVMDDADQQDLYIFGYGSIIWKNSEIPHTFSTSAFVRGYSRRFWHGSPDHRGTVDAPGRVVSLYTTADMEETGVKDRDIVQENTSDYNEPRVHGIAFLVTDEHRRKVCSEIHSLNLNCRFK